MKPRARGFTIVELIIVIVIIAFLATLTIFSFGSWRTRTAKTEVTNSLIQAATAMKNEVNFNNTYPTTLPSNISPPSGVVLELITASDGSAYCINGYSKAVPSVTMSISNTNSTAPSTDTCYGVSSSTIGGTVPNPPLNTPITLDFSTWSTTGTATYNSTTKAVTLGTNGTFSSPLIRVSGANSYSFTLQALATQQATYTGYQPDAAAHAGTRYFASDGVTAQPNTSPSPGPYTANGMLSRFAKTAVFAPATMGGWPLGNDIVYMKITLYSSASGYASPDVQIKDLAIILK